MIWCRNWKNCHHIKHGSGINAAVRLVKDPGTKEDFATLFSTRQDFFFFFAAADAHEEIQKTEKEKQRTRLLITSHEKKRYKTNTNIKYNLLLL